MDVIGQLASVLAGLPAIPGIARGACAAVLVMAQRLSRWMGVIVMVVAGVTLASSGAHAQNRIAEPALQATVPVEEAAGVPAVPTDRRVQGGESEQADSAIYSPFSAGASADEDPLPRTAAAPDEGDPNLTMTFAASAFGAVALVWLLRRI
jgi:hypothetical protein